MTDLDDTVLIQVASPGLMDIVSISDPINQVYALHWEGLGTECVLYVVCACVCERVCVCVCVCVCLSVMSIILNELRTNTHK